MVASFLSIQRPYFGRGAFACNHHEECPMRRIAKPLYFICLGITIGYFVFSAFAAYPAECWESGSVNKYCVD